MATESDDGDLSKFVGKGRAKKNDKKQLEAAAAQTKRDKESFGVMTYEEIRNSNGRPVMQGPYEIALRRIRPYFAEWGRKYDAMLLAYNGYARAGTMTGAQDVSVAHQICKMATELIDSAKKTLIALKIQESGLIPPHMMNTYRFRSMIRFNLLDFRGALNDATECLSIDHMLASDHDHYREVQGSNLEMRAQALMTRGNSRTSLAWGDGGKNVDLTKEEVVKELESAVVDLKGCCSAIRLKGKAWGNSQPTIGQVTSMLLTAMAMQKVALGASRPHYSLPERNKIQRELGLGMFSHEIYSCLNCHKQSSKTVKLQLCGRCKAVWLCSNDCLRAAWKAGHKRQCTAIPLRHSNISRIGLYDEMKADLYENVAEMGYAEVNSLDAEPAVLVQDEVSGRIFDSLSDAEVFFTPSEDHLLDFYTTHEQEYYSPTTAN